VVRILNRDSSPSANPRLDKKIQDLQTHLNRNRESTGSHSRIYAMSPSLPEHERDSQVP
jgi:hypothetical protein